MPKLTRVYTKARKQRGIVYPAQATEYSVAVSPESITIYKDDKNGIPVCGATFAIGDKAEYDSWNLRYIGDIAKIGAKTVTIVAYKGHPGMERAHQLDLNTFCYRNWNFNLGEAQAHNNTEMMYL